MKQPEVQKRQKKKGKTLIFYSFTKYITRYRNSPYSEYTDKLD